MPALLGIVRRLPLRSTCLDPINLGNWAWWVTKRSTPALLTLHSGDDHSVGVAEHLVGGGSMLGILVIIIL